LSQRLGESDPDDMALNESKDSAKRAYAKMTKSGTAASKLKAPIEKDANSERGLSSYHDEMQDKIAKMWIQAKGSMKNAQPNINSSFNSMNQHMSDMHQAGTLDQHYSKQQNLKTGAAQYHVSQEALKAQGMTDEMISKLKWENVQVKGSDGKMITKKMHELESREGLNAAPKKSSMNTEDWVT
jgi:hypothetical protein